MRKMSLISAVVKASASARKMRIYIPSRVSPRYKQVVL